MSSAVLDQTKRTDWVIDPTHSLVEFSVKHLMITTVKGRFGAVRGTVSLDAGAPSESAASVTIDAGSIDTRTEQRDQHLRSPDFLDVERFPTIDFRSTGVVGPVATPGDRFKLTGQLTIRGVTREVVLEAIYEGRGTDPWGGQRASFAATTSIDRRDYGLLWNQALETGGVLVGNEVKISIELQATLAIDVG
ncbi:MAG: YceI family protein [Gemmatimonadetes bacterium]|nr:YceI family protein [Gemmatimonadota bacterium]